jgi:hypothetical protein
MQDRDGGTDHNRRDFRLGVAGDYISYGDDAREAIVLVGNIEIKDIFRGGVIPDGFYGMSYGFVVFKRDEIGPHIGGDRFPQVMVAQFSRHYTPFGCDYTIKAGRNSIMLTILNLCRFVFSAKILNFRDKFDILSKMSLSSVVEQKYTRLYGKSQLTQEQGGKNAKT